MSRFSDSMKEAAHNVSTSTQARAAKEAETRAAAMQARPKLTAETIFQYLDWTVANAAVLGTWCAVHMQAAELAIRVMAATAQGKATQHTLVEDGIIAPPPQAS